MPKLKAFGSIKSPAKKPRKPVIKVGKDGKAKARVKGKEAAVKRVVKKITPFSERRSLKLIRRHRRTKLELALAKPQPIKLPPQILFRHQDNPIIEPRENKYWEMKATFNPAAVYADKRVHLLYRAIGGDDISVLGYASSADGINITERLEEPAYAPRLKPPPGQAEVPKEPVVMPAYCSGGGWNGGSEDPRLTLIDDTMYLTYTAFDGWGSIRVALSSIPLKNFLKKQWEWKEPMLLSPQGEINKNWVLFPEKIKGKFAILHSISPNILIDYVDDINEFEADERVIVSRYDRVSRTDAWDSWIRGAGPPPIKTKLGWLLFYHAMDIKDPNRYKLGAMILDINDPKKVLYRSTMPILQPDADYENQGFKSGVVYSCGAVVKDGELYVYYGGGDSVSCVAMAQLDTFLEELKKHGTPKLTPEDGMIKKYAGR